ncbi:MAG: magnesium transporter CorA family protein [bacterium]|nr:magnesium transporter CorA family protein [bacterium]
MKEILEIKEGLKWIDIYSPTPLDIHFLRNNFDFHPITLDELTHLSSRTNVDAYDHYLFIVTHFPVYNPIEKCSQQAEIDILIKKDVFITVHYQELEILDGLASFLKNEKIKRGNNCTYDLLYYLLGQINKYSLRQLAHIEEKVNNVGEKIFKRRERELLEQISYIKRDLTTFGIITWSQRNILESLATAGVKFWGPEVKIYFSDTLEDHWKVVHTYNKLKETLNDFDTTNAQLLDYKTNETMKIFTVLAFVTVPLMVVVSFLQINFINDLVADKPFLVTLILGLSVFLTIILILIFRRKKWL